MRLVTVVPRDRLEAGVVAGVMLPDGREIADLGRAVAVLGLGPASDVPNDSLGWFDLDSPWPGRAQAVLDACGDPGTREGLRRTAALLAVPDVRLRPPIPRPRKIVAVGLNYRDHAREAKLPVPEAPVIFAKFTTAVIGTGDAIVLPATSRRVDYEAELAVVIGRRTRGVSLARALEAVFGYTNANDVSDRDLQKRDSQWVRAKSCDTFAPLGPWVVSADEVGDVHDLRIQLRLNGLVMQDSSTRELVFSVPALVESIASTITLEPGDVILTGTPAGVGFARRPPVYLSAGDVVEVEIEGLGVLRNPVVRASVLP